MTRIELLTKTYNYKNIIVNLWANQHSTPTFSIDNECSHPKSIKQHCTSCGSFTGFWGEESDPYKFYEHTIEFVKNNQHSNIIIISKRIFPFDIITDKFSLFKIRHKRHLVIVGDGTLYLNILSIDLDLDKKVLYLDDYLNFLMNKVDNNSIFINPKKEDLGLPIKYEIRNSEIKYGNF